MQKGSFDILMDNLSTNLESLIKSDFSFRPGNLLVDTSSCLLPNINRSIAIPDLAVNQPIDSKQELSKSYF